MGTQHIIDLIKAEDVPLFLNISDHSIQNISIDILKYVPLLFQMTK